MGIEANNRYNPLRFVAAHAEETLKGNAVLSNMIKARCCAFAATAVYAVVIPIFLVLNALQFVAGIITFNGKWVKDGAIEFGRAFLTICVSALSILIPELTMNVLKGQNWCTQLTLPKCCSTGNSTIEDFDAQIRSECHFLRQQEAALRAKIKAFDDFIARNPGLLRGVMEAYEKDRGNIVGDANVPPTIAESDYPDVIQLRTKLAQVIVILESCLEERKQFIERNTAVKASFAQHVQALERNANVVLPLAPPQGNVLIEVVE